MPPKGVFFRGRAKGQKSSQKGGQKGGQKGQQSITNFVVASPSKPAASTASAAAEEEPHRPTKRQRTGSGNCGVAPIDEAGERFEDDSQQPVEQQEQQREGEQHNVQAAPASTGAPRRPISTAAKSPADKAALHRRLLGSAPSEAGGSAAAAAAAPIEPGADGSGAQQKLTPLEQQIVALKRQHPGVMLIVEVGYKAKLFGEDAVVGE